MHNIFRVIQIPYMFCLNSIVVRDVEPFIGFSSAKQIGDVDFVFRAICSAGSTGRVNSI